MKISKLLLVSAVALLLVMSACTPVKTEEAMMDKPTEAMMADPTDAMMDEATETMMPESTEAMMEEPTESTMMEATTTSNMMMDDTPTPDAMLADAMPTSEDMMDEPADDAMMEAPMWFSASLSNASDGTTFKIEDFKGKVVLVETMAVWCTNCRLQQEQIEDLHAAIGMPEDLVTVSLDIDTNENNDILMNYVASHGFDWQYAIAPAEVAREISQLYGDQFLNPTAAPMLIIDRNGEVHPLPFGIKSAEELMEAVEPYLNGM